LTIHFPPGFRSPNQTSQWQVSGGADGGRQEWTGIECLRALYRRRVTIACITGAALLAAALISALQPRSYEAEAALELQGVNDNFLNLRDVYPSADASTDVNGAYMLTQAELLQQDALIEEVVNRLGLDQKREFAGRRSFEGQVRKGAGPAGRASATRNAVAIVKNNLKVAPSRGSRIIRVAYDARTPQVAADVANAVAETFIERNIQARQRAAQETHDFLVPQLEEVKGRLARSEAALGRVYGSAAYLLLKQQVDADRKFYDILSQRVNEARVAATVRQADIRLVGRAQPPAHPNKPNLPLNLAIGTFGGLILAIGWVLLQEQSISVLRAPGEAGLCLTLPELGAIPKAAERSLEGPLILTANDMAAGVDRAALEQESSEVSESFRATLASIMAAAREGDHPRVIVVTSSRPMEGKTTVVSNLGIALTEISDRVLLIDGDMRRPRLHKVLGQANSWGLSDLLREKNAIEDLPLDVLVKKTDVPHLYLLPSGVCSENIFGLLCSSRMARLLPRFREEFDYVIVDAPPCLEFADARIMARYAEKLLLVVRANYTDVRTAQAAVQRLLLDGISVMGVILNRWDPANGDRYAYAPYYRLDQQEMA
jgi:succinoglycan biosynthesis transport protein ExoP